MVPHGEPTALQAVPVTFHVTAWFVVPTTFAANTCVAVGARLTLGGETLTTICDRTVICALIDCAGSAWLVAVRVTGFGEGTESGAKYSTVPAGAAFTT